MVPVLSAGKFVLLFLFHFSLVQKGYFQTIRFESKCIALEHDNRGKMCISTSCVLLPGITFYCSEGSVQEILSLFIRCGTKEL